MIQQRKPGIHPYHSKREDYFLMSLHSIYTHYESILQILQGDKKMILPNKIRKIDIVSLVLLTFSIVSTTLLADGKALYVANWCEGLPRGGWNKLTWLSFNWLIPPRA